MLLLKGKLELLLLWLIYLHLLFTVGFLKTMYELISADKEEIYSARDFNFTLNYKLDNQEQGADGRGANSQS